MSTEQDNLPDDVLKRSAAALRDMAVPDGPSAGLVEQTLARLLPAGRHTAALRRKWRIIPMRSLSRIAAAAVLVVALAGVSAFLLQSLGSGVAFAQLLDQIRKVHAVSFKLSGKVPLPQGQQVDMSADVLIVEPGRIRQTVRPPGMVQIMDVPAGKSLMLDPDRKEAILVETKNQPREQAALNILEELKKTKEDEGIRIGQKQIGEHKTEGFKMTRGTMEMSVWVDQATRLPVQIDMTMQAGIMMPAATMTMTDFVWDPPVDESMLSLTPPPGYEVRSMSMNMAPPTETDLVDALKAAGELNDGRFPPKFDLAGVSQVMGKRLGGALIQGKASPQYKQMEAKMLQLMPRVSRGWMFAADPKNGEDFHYAGMGVEAGKAGVPIFWYKPKGSEVYRVIDADFTIHEVKPADLPKEPSVNVGPPQAPAGTSPSGSKTMPAPQVLPAEPNSPAGR